MKSRFRIITLLRFLFSFLPSFPSSVPYYTRLIWWQYLSCPLLIKKWALLQTSSSNSPLHYLSLSGAYSLSSSSGEEQSRYRWRRMWHCTISGWRKCCGNKKHCIKRMTLLWLLVWLMYTWFKINISKCLLSFEAFCCSIASCYHRGTGCN